MRSFDCAKKVFLSNTIFRHYHTVPTDKICQKCQDTYSASLKNLSYPHQDSIASMVIEHLPERDSMNEAFLHTVPPHLLRLKLVIKILMNRIYKNKF